MLEIATIYLLLRQSILEIAIIYLLLKQLMLKIIVTISY